MRNLLLILGIIFVSSFIGFKLWSSYKDQTLVSPVLGVSKVKFADNLWFPQKSTLTKEELEKAPQITAESAFFVEANTGQVLYEKNAHERLPIASLTKIMTVIVALEHKTMDDVYKISQHAADMEPDKMLLIAGETLTLRELFDGIFLVSANDAAEAIAEGTTGRREEFIALMNSKAVQLGMNDTLMINPTGLEEDPSTCSGQVPSAVSGRAMCQYSSAFDVSLMSRYLINTWPDIVQISSQPHILIEKTQDHQDYDLYSGINLLTTYPGVMGLKTGYTPEAGLTLVTLARRGDKEVLGVLLGAVDRRDDAKLMLDYSFSKLGI